LFQIVGFCSETEEEFLETFSLVDLVKYNNLFMFPYSLREVMLKQRDNPHCLASCKKSLA
jgi:tRNA A37 methylthiotransferase MiaB